MSPLINDSDYVIMERHRMTSEQGKIVLIYHWSINDPDFGGEYTLKRFYRQKNQIELRPENRAYPSIVIKKGTKDIRIGGWFVKCFSPKELSPSRK